MTQRDINSRDDTSNLEKRLRDKQELVDLYKKLIDVNDARNELLENLIHPSRIKSTKVLLNNHFENKWERNSKYNILISVVS